MALGGQLTFVQESSRKSKTNLSQARYSTLHFIGITRMDNTIKALVAIGCQRRCINSENQVRNVRNVEPFSGDISKCAPESIIRTRDDWIHAAWATIHRRRRSREQVDCHWNNIQYNGHSAYGNWFPIKSRAISENSFQIFLSLRYPQI